VPDGAIWVSDPIAGICRVSIEGSARLSDSPWCTPGRQDDLDSDIFGDLPDADGDATERDRALRFGPADPSALAFDAQTDYLYASDRASSGGSIWRFRLDPVTGNIDEGEVIATTSDRIEAMTLGPATAGRSGSDLFFITKRDPSVMRVADPGGAAQTPVRVARATGGETAGMTATDDALYIADGGVTRYALDPVTGEARSEPMRGLGATAITSVIADPARSRLYAGTSSESGTGDVIKAVDLETGSVEDYELGFGGVTALGLDADGRLLVGDDPVVATGAEGTQNEGRLWSVAHYPLNRPAVSITVRPSAISAASSVSFSYASRPGASFECRIDDGPFAACDGTGDGRQTYEDLPEGEHRFSVRAQDGTTGLPASWAFRLDRTAPKVVVHRPSGDFVEGGPEPRVHFEVDEAGVTYQCSLDDGPYRECWSGNRLEDLTAGTHTLRVVGTDEAGNRSDAADEDASVEVIVRARPRAQAPAPTPSPEPAPVGVGPLADARPADGPRADVTTVAPRPRLRSFRVRMTRTTISARGRLEVRFAAGEGGSRLHLTVRDRRGRTVLSRTITARRTGVTLIRSRLTGSEQRRLAPGRYRVTGVLSDGNGRRSDPAIRDLRFKR
jgi:hypothetical protein